MTWARDLARVIRTAERDAGLRSAEVLRDGGWSCHGQVDLTGDFLLHPIRGAPSGSSVLLSAWDTRSQRCSVLVRLVASGLLQVAVEELHALFHLARVRFRTQGLGLAASSAPCFR